MLIWEPNLEAEAKSGTTSASILELIANMVIKCWHGDPLQPAMFFSFLVFITYILLTMPNQKCLLIPPRHSSCCQAPSSSLGAIIHRLPTYIYMQVNTCSHACPVCLNLLHFDDILFGNIISFRQA